MTEPGVSFTRIAQRLQRHGGPPLYKQLKRLIAEMIAQGQLGPGDPVLPQRDLSALLRISEVTVRRATQELVAEGLLEARAGSGTTVVDTKLREMNLGRPLRIGVVLANLTDGYPFLARMMDLAERDGASHEVPSFQLFNVPVQTDPDSLDLPLRSLDGLVLMSPVNLGLVALCQRLRLAYVLLYNDIADGLSRCIVVDYTTGILEAVRHLMQHGRRRIALVTAAESRFSTGQMTDAYHAALHLHRLEWRPQWLIHGGYEENQGYQATQRLISISDRPDAILFASDYQARGGLIALQEAGLSVPGDVAVIGAGRMLRDKEWPVRLTTIDLHFEKVGQLAVQTLRQLREQKAAVPFRQVIRSSLVLGETA